MSDFVYSCEGSDFLVYITSRIEKPYLEWDGDNKRELNNCKTTCNRVNNTYNRWNPTSTRNSKKFRFQRSIVKKLWFTFHQHTPGMSI